MPSKIRMILGISGMYYTGNNVKKMLMMYMDKYGQKIPEQSEGEKQWQWLARVFVKWQEKIGAGQTFWVFRENRKVEIKKSRYKTLCGWGGWARESRKKRSVYAQQLREIEDALLIGREANNGNRGRVRNGRGGVGAPGRGAVARPAQRGDDLADNRVFDPREAPIAPQAPAPEQPRFEWGAPGQQGFWIADPLNIHPRRG